MRSREDDAELPLSDRRRVADDVRGELEFHIEQRAAELIATGMTRERAFAEARELFGDRETIEEQCRQIERRRRHAQVRTHRARALRQDLTIGLRLLRKSPAFTIAAILTLALGIGANAAVFSIINQVILQPLDYTDADRLVTVQERHKDGGWGNVPWSTFLDLQQQSNTFEAMASYSSDEVTVLGGGTAARVRGAVASRDFFKVFGIQAYRGRLPAPEEHVLGAPPVAVVSHAFWRDHLGSAESLDSIRLRLNLDHAVIGVLPPQFDFPGGTQVWTPLELLSQSTSRTSHNWNVVGKLRPDVSASTAERELAGLISNMERLHAPDFDATGSVVTGLQASMTDGVETPLYLLFAASAVLLLAACTNLASAQLARGTARAGELAIRAALGAGRRRLVRQLLTESMLLAVGGAATGLLLAFLLLRIFSTVAPPSLSMETVHIDLWVAAFALIVATVTAVLFGLYPALRLSETNAAVALREGSRGTANRGHMRAWNVLIAAEITLALTLLSSSVILIRSFNEVMSVDLGFDATNVHTALVDLPAVNYNDSTTRTARFHEVLLERLANTPGVTAAGFANVLPLEGGNPNGAMEVEGKPHDPRGPWNGYAIYRVVGGDYFEALGIRVVAGRALGASDGADAPRAVVVNEEFARLEWPGVSPIGRRVRPAGMDSDDFESWFTVVGVVASVRASSVTEPFAETYYFDHRQRPPGRSRSVSYVLRSTLPPSQMATLLRREVAAVDPLVPVRQGTMARVVEEAVASRRFMMLLLGAFASLALVLALVGIYAVVSYTVAQRTRELGVRLALGATPARLRMLVLRSALQGIVPGLIAGTLLSVASVRLLRGFVYGISPGDPLSLVLALVILGIIGMAATLVPARRATRVDPMIAMRAE